MDSPRTVLVTGGNRGIGLAIVERLSSEGLRVILGAREVEAGQREAARLGKQGAHVEAITLDVSRRVAIDAALAALDERRIAIDVLVNNAGVLPEGDLLTLSDEDIDV